MTAIQSQSVLLQPEEASNHLVRRLLTLQDKALTNLESILDNEEAEDAIRLRASMGILDFVFKLSKLKSESDDNQVPTPKGISIKALNNLSV